MLAGALSLKRPDLKKKVSRSLQRILTEIEKRALQ